MIGYPLSFVARCSLVICASVLTGHCLLPTALGQSTTATLSGTVVDQNGAAIPGASITVENTSVGLKRQATTTSEGYFTIPLLPPGTYSVRAEGQGFAPVDTKDVILNIGDRKTLQIQLKAGDVNAAVTVE